MSTDNLSNKKRTARKTFYGFASLIIAMISVLFLTASFAITMIDISPAIFFNLNNLTYLVYCSSTPLALGLGVWGFTRKNDSTLLSVVAMGLVGLPFLFLFWRFINALIRYN